MQDIPWQARPFVQRRHRKVVTRADRAADRRGARCRSTRTRCARRRASCATTGVEAVAVCFLFSYLNPEHERRAAAIVREEMPDAFVTTSADIFPQFREFERFTTACDERVRRPEDRQLPRPPRRRRSTSEGVDGELHVMMSSGGVAGAQAAAERPVTLLLSGPGGRDPRRAVGRRARRAQAR